MAGDSDLPAFEAITNVFELIFSACAEKHKLKKTCLLNSVITDHCFYRFVYILLVLIFTFLSL